MPPVGVYEAPLAKVVTPLLQPPNVYPALTMLPPVGRLIAPLDQFSLVFEGVPLLAPWLLNVITFPH